MENTKIVFLNGQILSVGDTFFFVHPEYHDGTIQKCKVDSFLENDAHYGRRIRFTVDNKSMWLFVWQKFFESERPTCFLNLEDAQKAASDNLYSDFRH